MASARAIEAIHAVPTANPISLIPREFIHSDERLIALIDEYRPDTQVEAVIERTPQGPVLSITDTFLPASQRDPNLLLNGGTIPGGHVSTEIEASVPYSVLRGLRGRTNLRGQQEISGHVWVSQHNSSGHTGSVYESYEHTAIFKEWRARMGLSHESARGFTMTDGTSFSFGDALKDETQLSQIEYALILFSHFKHQLPTQAGDYFFMFVQPGLDQSNINVDELLLIVLKDVSKESTTKQFEVYMQASGVAPYIKESLVEMNHQNMSVGFPTEWGVRSSLYLISESLAISELDIAKTQEAFREVKRKLVNKNKGIPKSKTHQKENINKSIAWVNALLAFKEDQVEEFRLHVHPEINWISRHPLIGDTLRNLLPNEWTLRMNKKTTDFAKGLSAVTVRFSDHNDSVAPYTFS